MAHDLSVLCFEADCAEIVASPESARWVLEKAEPLGILTTISPQTSPDEKFQAHLVWSDYPANPPSLRFRNPATGSLTDPHAWPQCPGFRPTSFDACVNWTAEGHALHPEWRLSAATRWDPTGNALFRVLCILQDTLDFSFSGRHP